MKVVNDNLLSANLSIKWAKLNTMLDSDEDGFEFNTHPRELETVDMIRRREQHNKFFDNWKGMI